MTPRGQSRRIELVGPWALAAAFAIASAGIAAPTLAQLPSADSAAACRGAIQVRGVSPDTRHAILAFDQPAALLCTALPATADTLEILAALAERGDRALIGHYALIVADQHFRASRNSGERRDIERALASLRVAYGIDSSHTTGFLLGATATTLALLLQESGLCADAARAPSLLVEARSGFPAGSNAADPPPDWATLDRKAKENEERACRRRGVRAAEADPPEN
ncbi:MAG TPA: hypothetical protein VJ802_07625 [Gemmatimonadaceae bacterium]|nr:hypothetical protein [Gemmatimonadaceae bacterium]